MVTFKQLLSGNRRAQVRRTGSYASETFRRHEDAQEWTLATERRIDLGETPSRSAVKDPTTVGDLIDLHIADMKDVQLSTLCVVELTRFRGHPILMEDGPA